MKNLIILNNNIPAYSFLTVKLLTTHYSDIYLGAQSYQNHYNNLLSSIDKDIMQDTQIIESNATIKSIADLKNLLLQLNLEHITDLNILYFDLGLYPYNKDHMINFIEKVLMSVESIKCTSDNTNFPLSVFKINTKELHKFPMTTPINDTSTQSINITKLFFNINDTKNALSIFHSNIDIRHFNNLSNTNKYYFFKSSSNKNKMREEYDFLKNIPAELQLFFPQAGEFIEDKDKDGYFIEKIDDFDVALLLKNKTLLKDNNFTNFLSAIEDYLKILPHQTVDKSTYKAAMKELFITKVADRVQHILKLKHIDKLNALAQFNDYINVVNFADTLEKSVNNSIEQNHHDTLYFSHGDLCFSNILYNNNTGKIKLIDPRGYKNNITSTFRPIYYDVAKLSHSVLGLYDLIIANMARISLTNTSISIIYDFDQNLINNMKHEFSIFCNKLGFNIKMIRLFEATLFLSMIPLHQDNEQRTMYQLIQAMKSYEESL